MSKLYELSEEYLQLLDMLEDEEVDEEVVRDTLEGIEGEFEEKADAIAMTIQEAKADAEKINQEIQRLQGRKKACENRAEWLKRYLENAMRVTGKKKFATALFGYGIQKTAPAVVIDKMEEIPEEYWKPQEPKLDKVALKRWLKDHEEDYAHLEQAESLRIR